MKDLINKLNSSIGQINPHYDATYQDIEAINNAAESKYELICLSFRFGYMQGTKAALAKQRKKAGASQ